MKYFIKTYGCTFNKSDSDRIILLAEGVHELSTEAKAQVIVLNSCSVKDATQQKILYEVRRIRKPLVVTGCLAQAMPELIEEANSKASVIGCFAHERMNEAITTASEGKKLIDVSRKHSLPLVVKVDGLVARIPINLGCTSACSYCSTKLARGNLRSFPPKDVINCIQESVAKGAKEIQLCSQDTGCYGLDLGCDLTDLLERISEIKGDFMVRVGMLNPEHFLRLEKRLLKAFSSEKVFKFLHLPLQSGSNTVLKHMRRNYSRAEFKKAFYSFRKVFPDSVISTDVIVGYPTETEKDFQETLSLLKELRFDVVNVSKYSARPNTIAASLPQLPNNIIKKRSENCSALCRKISLEQRNRFVGRRFKVLLFGNGKNKGQKRGRSSFYASFVVSTPVALGEWVEVKALKASASCLLSKTI
ncbi:MAG: tRNA (N(6)-L-threonylcarbamoyladenosine(37)-C(2))-methylthiotransferase [Candidatus Micrarchaeota archaeon]